MGIFRHGKEHKAHAILPLICLMMALSLCITGCKGKSSSRNTAKSAKTNTVMTRIKKQTQPRVQMSWDIDASMYGNGEEEEDTYIEVLTFVRSCREQLNEAEAAGNTREFCSKYWNIWPNSSDESTTFCSEFVGWNLKNVGLIPGQTMPEWPESSNTYIDFYGQHPELAEMHENDGTYTPKPGDIVLFHYDWNRNGEYGHTEMVETVAANGQSWNGISGGDHVSATQRQISDKTAAMFITIKWDQGPLDGIGIEKVKSSEHGGTGNDDPRRKKAVEAARSQLGLPYIWGEELPGQGFDCNSLTHYAWAQAGVDIPYPSGHYDYGQFQWMKESGRWVNTVEELKLGDLVFWSNDGGASIYHVGLYSGNGNVIHANGYGWGVIESSYDLDSGFCGGGSPI